MPTAHLAGQAQNELAPVSRTEFLICNVAEAGQGSADGVPIRRLGHA